MQSLVEALAFGIVPQGAVTWLCTYLLHSTFVASLALLVARRESMRRAAQSLLLCALVFPLLTASVQACWVVGKQSRPDSFRSSVELPVSQATGPASTLLTALGAGLMCAWLGLALVRGHAVYGGLRRLRAALRVRVKSTDAQLEMALAGLSSRAGLRGSVRLSHSMQLASPAVVSASEICIPSSLQLTLTHDELRAVLAHEVAHLVRLDWLWFPLVALLDCALCVQPLNRLLARTLRNQAELDCDERAAALLGESKSLARALVRVAETCVARREVQVLPLMNGTRNSIVHRVERLLNRSQLHGSRRKTPWALLPLYLLVTPCGFVLPRANDVAGSNAATALTFTNEEQLELYAQRHQLDVQLQEQLWERGVSEEADSIHELQAEIRQLDALLQNSRAQ